MFQNTNFGVTFYFIYGYKERHHFAKSVTISLSPRWEKALEFPEVKLHLYGKREARVGRKMGHMTVMATTAEKARELALQAHEAL